MSHTNSNHRDFALAHRIATTLVTRGVKVWIVSASIAPGDRWEQHIVSGVLNQCAHFLVIPSAPVIKIQVGQ